MTTEPSKRDYIIIVSGLPRSGTSMVMNAIGSGGIDLLIDHVRKPDEDNPTGYYEFEPVKKTKEDATWIKEAVGKVVKMVYRLLYDLPDEYQYRVVFALRDLTEVLASQNKMLGRSGTSAGSIPDGRMQALFADELNRCEKWLAKQPNFKVLYIDHHDMISGALAQAQKINDFLDGGLDEKAMASIVDPRLYRNRNQ